MRVVQTIAEMRAATGAGHAINLVPTMGNLHEGHLSLVQVARQREGIVVASIFVNPLQFSPHEDFADYPRTLSRDCELLSDAGCDLVFAPSATEIYPEEQLCKVTPPPALADVLEGHFRRGFFVGVCTVVLKLFAIAQPSVAVFGKKDYQQLRVIENMVRQFALPITVLAAETVRATSGLALSSRNGYLDDEQRVEAAQLHRVLCQVADASRRGGEEVAALERFAMTSLQARGWSPDYVVIRHRHDLSAISPTESPHAEPLVVIGAAKLGATRLIDSIEI